MYNVLVTGAGKIGSLIACMLADSKDYQVHLADKEFSGSDVERLIKNVPEVKTVALDVQDAASFEDYIAKNNIVACISSLPFFLNPYVAKACCKQNIHYFDLTEDVEITNQVKEIASKASSAFVPQCGLAPGFISIAANSLLQDFDECIEAKLRVGALPANSSNSLHYSLTWSTDGIINEYGNPCYGIENGIHSTLKPLEDVEHIQIDGALYEAFNTSGGIGSLGELYKDKIQTLNYKTMRYPGHVEKMRFLMNDLNLNEDRETLKNILEKAIPKTYQDVVVIYVSAKGKKDNELIETNYVKKIFPKTIRNIDWSAIQVSTSSGVCAVVDMVLGQANEYQGLIYQENFTLKSLLKNRFGKNYA